MLRKEITGGNNTQTVASVEIRAPMISVEIIPRYAPRIPPTNAPSGNTPHTNVRIVAFILP